MQFSEMHGAGNTSRRLRTARTFTLTRRRSHARGSRFGFGCYHCGRRAVTLPESDFLYRIFTPTV